MATTIKNYYFIGICIIILGFATPRKSVGQCTENQLREAWFSTSLKYVGVREKTNRNDHDSIYVFNKYARSGKFSPYCAAGLYYTAHRSGMDLPGLKYPAAVRSWFDDPSKIIWDRYRSPRWRTPPKLMDVVWIFGSHIEAIATWHLPRDIEDSDYILTVGFNTSGNTGKHHGVWYPIRRRWRDVKRVANHVSPYARDHECE